MNEGIITFTHFHSTAVLIFSLIKRERKIDKHLNTTQDKRSKVAINCSYNFYFFKENELD